MGKSGPMALALAPLGIAVLIVAALSRLAALGLPWREFVRAGTAGLRDIANQLPEPVQVHLMGALYTSLPLAGIAAISGALYKLYCMVSQRIQHALSRHCKVTLVFSSTDKHYDVVIDYIGSKCDVETGVLMASTEPRTRPSFQEMLASWLGGKMKTPSLYYQPQLRDFSEFFFWTDERGTKHKIWISRHIDKPQFRSDSAKGRDPEQISLSVWWTSDSQVLKDFMNSALKTMLREDGNGTVDIYVKHMWLPMWTKAISRDKRDRETVVLDEGLADYVLEDMRHFFTRKTADWYHNAGIPYRRGYLLYGPPGCGKTSFAQVLAGELSLDVCLMNLSNNDMNDDDLAELLRAAPARSMLLLEDVDAIFVERAASSQKRGGGVSFSGLLNALDGAAAQEGCVIMLTTNHKDRLDEALIRPGRCDIHVKVEKATQDQAKRMFYRFFSREAKIDSIDGAGWITTAVDHSFESGDLVRYKAPGDGRGTALLVDGRPAEHHGVFYAQVAEASGSTPSRRRLRLYSSREAALQGSSPRFLRVAGGQGALLQELPEAAARFSSRIPERQVSMAKLQGYLMKQKLLAEQDLKKQRDRDELPGHIAVFDPADELYKLLCSEEVRRIASETAVINVHELLDVKVEAEEIKVTLYDHLRRVGLHRFAPFFEHFGIRQKAHLTAELADKIKHWGPDFKIGSPQQERLLRLIKGDKILDDVFALADLSVLRDRFISAFQSGTGRDGAPAEPAAPPPPALDRACSEPASASRALAPTRLALIRASTPGKETTGLRLIEMAHEFQEALEDCGKTNVSMWQLEMHFQRYAGDPSGALQNCRALVKSSADRAHEECLVHWMTTFQFLRRIGLEKYAFKLEDAGYKYWADFKHMSKDDLKNELGMSGEDATLCHAVLSGNEERADLLRKFHIPEFADLQALFAARFPQASPDQARRFAVQLTDELGVADFSCLQVKNYLDGVGGGPAEASHGLRDGLTSLEAAEAARVRPPAPPAPPGHEDKWVYGWLKEIGLEEFTAQFVNQAIMTREDVLGAPMEHDNLQSIGITKLGERCMVIRHLLAERAK
mmetsp:Transcript_108744/g.307411  ORF Transcript_108744/g.307411 Transcript_108744/m.307411 type:complete len:1066 (+) Transcript_108744:60-3257(+)